MKKNKSMMLLKYNKIISILNKNNLMIMIYNTINKFNNNITYHNLIILLRINNQIINNKLINN
jgi:hypothetical protein